MTWYAKLMVVNNDKLFAVFGKIVLIIVVLGIVAAGAYYFGVKSSQKSSPQPQLYNQSSPTPSITTSVENLTPTPSVDETSVIKTAVKNALIAEHGSDASSLNITVSKIQGNYATGDASAQGGGGLWFAAKVNGQWKLVWDGNGNIQCSSLTAYPNFPTSMIPQCWDDKTQNVVTR